MSEGNTNFGVAACDLVAGAVKGLAPRSCESTFSESAHPLPCQRGQLYCAAQERSRACCPKCCRGEGLGQVPCLPQVSQSKEGATFSRPHHHMASSSTHTLGVGSHMPPSAGPALLCYPGVQALFSRVLQPLTVDGQGQLFHFNDLRASSPPAVGGKGEGRTSLAHVTVWQMRGQTRSLMFTFLGPAHLHPYQ